MSFKDQNPLIMAVLGPTNTGKTYLAVERMLGHQSGMIGFPLRLLARENYDRVVKLVGKTRVALITGEEKIIPKAPRYFVCTVESMPISRLVDFMAIDEIQLCADPERGHVFTDRLLNARGRLETMFLGALSIKSVMKLLIPKIKFTERPRFSKLSYTGPKKLNRISKRSAVVAFSANDVYSLAEKIRSNSGGTAVVLGALSPRTRNAQVEMYQSGEVDYLVATDAIGMGINMDIDNVYFTSLKKFDGKKLRRLNLSEISQIAGRAGRFKTAQQAIDKEASNDTEPLALDLVKKPTTNVGYVTTLTRFDLGVVREAMETEVEPLSSVGIFPPADILFRFASYFPPKTPFGYITLRLHDMASLHPQFHLCRLKEQIQIADLIQEFDLSIMDRITLMSSPASVRDSGMIDVVKSLAQCIAEKRKGALLDMQCFDLELIDRNIHEDVDGTKGYLRKAEALHRAITLYLWLSYRFAGVFTNQALAFHVKSLIEEKIDQCLGEVSWTEAQRKTRNFLRMKAVKAAAKEDELAKAAAIGFEADEPSVAPEQDETELETDQDDLDKAWSPGAVFWSESGRLKEAGEADQEGSPALPRPLQNR